MIMRFSAVFVALVLVGALGCEKTSSAEPVATKQSVATTSNGEARSEKANASEKPAAGTRISGDEARKLVALGAKLVDVRTPREFAAGHVEGAINIPVGDLGSRLAELNPSEPVVVYCRSGARSNRAMGMMQKAGYAQVWDMGPFSAW